MLVAFAAALFGSPIAQAASDQLKPIVITPSSGCGLLTAYTAGTGLPAWSGPAPSCGAGAFTLAFNQGNTPPPATLSLAALGRRAAPCLAWSSSGVPDGARMGYQITAPPGITIKQRGLRRQPVAEHRRRARVDRVHLLERRHCSRASERDRGRRGGLRSVAGHQPEHCLLGDRAALCAVDCARGQGRSSSTKSRCTRPRRRGRASPPLPTPAACGTRPDQGGGSGTRQVTPGPSPWPERIRRASVP